VFASRLPLPRASTGRYCSLASDRSSSPLPLLRHRLKRSRVEWAVEQGTTATTLVVILLTGSRKQSVLVAHLGNIINQATRYVQDSGIGRKPLSRTSRREIQTGMNFGGEISQESIQFYTRKTTSPARKRPGQKDPSLTKFQVCAALILQSPPDPEP
jgi:hypothetical protein